jgi:hypothetical protein
MPELAFMRGMKSNFSPFDDTSRILLPVPRAVGSAPPLGGVCFEAVKVAKSALGPPRHQ